MTACAVVGGGAWGTALADLLARNGHNVVMWAREPDVVSEVNTAHRNSRFLPGVSLAPALRAEADAARAVRDARFVVYAPPSQALRAVLNASRAGLVAGATLVVASKGIERERLLLMTEVVAESARGHPIVALSGPSFAAEVAAKQPTAVVAAGSPDPATAVQQLLSTPTFRVYTHDDVIGVELGGALKNVMAVATGIAEGCGLGHNSRAALITRGLAEMTRLGTALGASPATFAGLAGVGDLVLTCTGGLSRNRTLGVEVGQGRALADVLASRDTVAEGVENAESAERLAIRHGVEMPIVHAVNEVLFGGRSPREAIGGLMGRELRAERD